MKIGVITTSPGSFASAGVLAGAHILRLRPGMEARDQTVKPIHDHHGRTVFTLRISTPQRYVGAQNLANDLVWDRRSCGLLRARVAEHSGIIRSLVRVVRFW